MLKELKHENRVDGVIAIVAALIVLVIAIIDALSSTILAIAGLIVYAIYKFTRKK